MLPYQVIIKQIIEKGKKLIKFFKLFEVDTNFGYRCIIRLFESDNVVVKTEAASYCLALNYKTEYAVSVLKKIADDSENGIFGFNAMMIIKEWEKNGSLKLYQ